MARPAPAQHNHTTRLGLNFELLNFDWNMAKLDGGSRQTVATVGLVAGWPGTWPTIATTHCLSCHILLLTQYGHTTFKYTYLKPL